LLKYLRNVSATCVVTWGSAAPAALASASSSWMFDVVGNTRSTSVIVLAVTPLDVAPPLLPLNFAMQGSA